MKNKKTNSEASSFRDPSGLVFFRNNRVYRQIHASYIDTFDQLESQEFFQKLLKHRQVLPYTNAPLNLKFDSRARRVIQPEALPFVSYPYEWSFGQLKSAALATLEIQQLALDSGFSLKDASAFNIQFTGGKAALIDHLSFELYTPGKPWVAYQQFCRHFLAPLALMKYRDLRMNDLSRLHIDGVPLDIAQKLLPHTSLLNLGLALHLHLHAQSQKKFAAQTGAKHKNMGKVQLLGLIENLKSTVSSLQLPAESTEWGDYYTFTNYSAEAFAHKKKIIANWIKKVSPASVWDLGGNNGEFSRLASDQKIFTICFDIDPIAVEKNYQSIKKNQEAHLLPLRLDLTNPSPSLGWAHQERSSLAARGPADLTMALALIHHLAISNNLPFRSVAEYLHTLGEHLIIEFVPKSDSQVKKLLSTRDDIFPEYTENGFEQAFSSCFRTLEKKSVGHGSERILYLMKAQ